MAPNLQAGAPLGYALNRTRLRPELPMAEPRRQHSRHRPQYGRTLVTFNGRGDTAAEPMGPGAGAWPNHTFGAKAEVRLYHAAWLLRRKPNRT